LEIMDKLTINSELTEEDVMKIDKVIKKGLAKHYQGN